MPQWEELFPRIKITSGSPKCSNDSKTKNKPTVHILKLILKMGFKSYINIFGLVGWTSGLEDDILAPPQSDGTIV